MLPGAFDLELYRGDTARWQFVLWQDEAKTQPADLTGVTAAAQIRATPDSPAVVELLTQVVPPNIVNVALGAGDAAGLSVQLGFWDLQLTYPGGDVKTILAGSVLVVADVTRLAAE
jgi:hypothetical protein